MTRTASFHRLAERELNEAAQYYDSESPGLGAAFLNEIERCVGRILEHPEAGLILVGNVRRRLARRFPYAVLYSIKPGGVRILAVMNLKRRPMYWVGRE
ncbi:type II toxin-antitoxin system RelE/ParE family toxin [Acidobacteria bacterium AH-259-L09]|nr:type II toxin-antitoxin system RelE/ParE family toxin [Acidobacteria bacterium AH-259-L09]